MKEKAFFVERPRTIEDLMQPHLLAHVKTIELGKIDYENFVTDMLADRQFIEDNAGLCPRGEVWQCLLIRQKGCTDGILVVPESGCFVGWAAYYAHRIMQIKKRTCTHDKIVIRF